MTKVAIFDADGTLLDSMSAWEKLGERYLHSIGIKVDEGLSDVIGSMTLDESSVYLKEKYFLEDDAEKIGADMMKLLRGFYCNEVEAKSGVPEFLEAVKKRRIPMVIVTFGERELLLPALERLGLNEYFDAILTCTELRTSKKDPYIYLRAADIIGAAPENIAVFEDSLFAIETAGKAGFITVAVEDASNINEREALKKTAARYIKDFTEFSNNIFET